jgi:outer membrane protein assembly factor BamD
MSTVSMFASRAAPVFRTMTTDRPDGFRPTPRRLTAAAIPLLALALVLGGCASGGNNGEQEYVERSVSELYNNALDSLKDGNHREAARLFDEVERQHPYSTFASKAQLMAAYAHYLDNRYEDAINALNRFIELHPGNRDVSYAYYLKALSYYERISDVRRDQKMTLEARDALEEVVKRFPESKYARDARLKLDLTQNHLAGKEMAVGRFYLENGHHLAAINRFRTVVEEYQTTGHVPEALHRLVEAYLALGIRREAQASAAVLGHNYPGSDWYRDSYALLQGEDITPERSADSWVDRMWDSLS